jgi:hypothetical protein
LSTAQKDDGREPLFAKLRETLNPTQLTIYGGLYVSPERQQGLWLEPDQMRLLEACGAGWDIDLFVVNVSPR